MKYLLIILGLLLVASTTYGQITISNDSILSNDDFLGRYEVHVVEGLRLKVRILSNTIEDSTQQNEIEKAIERQINSQAFNKFQLQFTYILDESKLTPTQVGGIKFKEVGKAYNGAAAISIIGSVGGSVLAFSGYPIAGSIITLSSSIIAFIVQITGNNKLIKGGESLQRQK